MQKLGFLLLVLLVSACATPKPAPNSFNDAEEAIEVAVQAGAEEHSPVELRFAREKLAEAQKGMEYKSYEKAIYLIEQSEINSELAIAKCRAAVARGLVTEAARENEILEEDFEATFGSEFK
jgi:sulfur relay (sulfurtransferase) complex TusBCD TusD component (DsrE family)